MAKFIPERILEGFANPFDLLQTTPALLHQYLQGEEKTAPGLEDLARQVANGELPYAPPPVQEPTFTGAVNMGVPVAGAALMASQTALKNREAQIEAEVKVVATDQKARTDAAVHHLLANFPEVAVGGMPGGRYEGIVQDFSDQFDVPVNMLVAAINDQYGVKDEKLVVTDAPATNGTATNGTATNGTVTNGTVTNGGDSNGLKVQLAEYMGDATRRGTGEIYFLWRDGEMTTEEAIKALVEEVGELDERDATLTLTRWQEIKDTEESDEYAQNLALLEEETAIEEDVPGGDPTATDEYHYILAPGTEFDVSDVFGQYADPADAMFESVLRKRLGERAYNPAVLKAGMRGSDHAVGNYLLMDLDFDDPQRPKKANYYLHLDDPEYGKMRDMAENQASYERFVRAANVLYSEDAPENLTWVTDDEKRRIANEDLLAIGNTVRNPRYERAILKAKAGITGKGILGELRSGAVDMIVKQWQDEQIADPTSQRKSLIAYASAIKNSPWYVAPQGATPTALSSDTEFSEK